MHEELGPEDFYINEEGFMVFTETYLLQQGKCCHSGCKHCPYQLEPTDNLTS